MRDVDDVHEQVRVLELLERRAECGDEGRRQLVHEAHGVGEQHDGAVRERRAPRRRVERREGLVGHEDIGTGQRVHQRRLARVRVAHERREEEPVARARGPRRRTLLLHLREAALQVEEAALDDATVGLEERLAGTAGADAAAEPREALPEALQAREHVLHLRELHLHATLFGARVLGEDVDDHARAVDHAHLRELLEVLLLPRRELLVADQQVDLGPPDLLGYLFHLALSHPEVRVGRAARLRRAADDVAAGRGDERRELVERVVHVEARARHVQTDEVGALGRGGGLDHAATSRRMSANGSPAVGSDHRISVSRLNHVICLRAYARVSRTVRAIASSSGSVPARWAAQWTYPCPVMLGSFGSRPRATSARVSSRTPASTMRRVRRSIAASTCASGGARPTRTAASGGPRRWTSRTGPPSVAISRYRIARRRFPFATCAASGSSCSRRAKSSSLASVSRLARSATSRGTDSSSSPSSNART